MFKQVVRRFVDCSVGKKLLLGFGLVSLLAVLAIAQGQHVTASLLGQSREVGERVTINQLVLQMHAAQKAYALAPGPATQAEVQRLLQALAGRLDELTADRATDTDGLSGSLRAALNSYREQFADFALHQRQAGEALARMQEQAEHARLQFEAVQLDMYDQVRAALNDGQLLGGDPLSLAEQASTLQRELLVARSLEFAYG